MSEETGRRLDRIRLFADLDREALGALERACHWRQYTANEKILDRDNEDRDVFFVIEGSALVVNYSQTGREIALARIAAGSYFGELAAIDGRPRSAGVVVIEDCLVATMSPTTFNQLMLDHPQLAQHLLQRLARIVRACDDRIMDLSTLGAVQRVYIELLRLADRDPAGSDAWVIWPMPAQREIAGQASTTRETDTRAIRHLVADGEVARQGKSLYIRDRARLAGLAAGLAADWGEDRAR